MMTPLRNILAQLGERVEDPVHALRHRWLKRHPNRLYILPYRSFGTQTSLRLKGRVLTAQHNFTVDADDRWWENLSDMVQRFASREVGGVTLQASLGQASAIGTTDNEGYFSLELKPPKPQPSGWHLVNLITADGETAAKSSSVPDAVGGASATAEVLVPPLDARFGVISDVDDTIMVTHASRMLKMARMVLLNNARSRLPFPGVAAFYRALHDGAQPERDADAQQPINNPIFYVSSSAWNLYDLLVDFMVHNSIPSGPLLLADYGVSKGSFPFTSHDAHKHAQIERIMSTYPDLPFILIGDSGQRDPAIYRQVVADMPGRVLAIYIRSVDTMQQAQVERVGSDVEMITAYNTLPLAQHAVERGWIKAKSLPKIDQDAAKDQGAPFPLEAMLEEDAAG